MATYVSLTDDLSLDRQMRHNIEVVVDRLKAAPSVRTRLAEAVDAALGIGKGNIIVAVRDDEADAERIRASRGVLATECTDATERGRRTARLARHPRSVAQPARSPATRPLVALRLHRLRHQLRRPTPQLFSFNSPQGMCLTCDGLGEMFSFDPDRLVPDTSKSFEQGCIELIGSWKDLGRWKRHIYRGVAETMDRKLGLDEGTLLEKPWKELTKKQRDIWLWGTGDEHITYTWRAGKAAQKYGGTFDGLIPELLEKYSTSKSTIADPPARKVHEHHPLPRLRGPAAQSAGLRRHACKRPVRDSPISRTHAARSLRAADFRRRRVLLRRSSSKATKNKSPTKSSKKSAAGSAFCTNVGLEYLSLDRTAPTLSGGESQRIRLAGQVGCGLVGVLYILDEPSIGLHPRDNQRLLDTLAELRDLGNTVVVVEHDEDTMRAADHLIDFGPGPGVRGGEVVAIGTADQIAREPRSATGAFLSGKRKIEVPQQRRIEPEGTNSERLRDRR